MSSIFTIARKKISINFYPAIGAIETVGLSIRLLIAAPR